MGLTPKFQFSEFASGDSPVTADAMNDSFKVVEWFLGFHILLFKNFSSKIGIVRGLYINLTGNFV